MATPLKIPVTTRALIQRIKRKLAAEKLGHELRGTMGRGARTYYLLDAKRRAVIDPKVDLEGLGRRLKVLDEWERLSD